MAVSGRRHADRSFVRRIWGHPEDRYLNGQCTASRFPALAALLAWLMGSAEDVLPRN